MTMRLQPGPALLSQIIGQPVHAFDGRSVGHVADLSVDLGTRAGPNLVRRLLVHCRHTPDLLVPWSSIDRFGSADAQLAQGVDPTPPTPAPGLAALDANEILLHRDVLDTQIVDVAGRRLARVADIVLVGTVDGRLELVGVEVGFGGVLRRLGMAWLAARVREDVVAWTDLHLTSQRGHTVQLATPRSAVHHLDAAELAVLVGRLDTTSAAEVLAARAPALAAAAVRADPTVGERVLRAMPDKDAAELVAAMPAEHATRWRTRLTHPPALLGRRFLRSRVWPRHHRGI